MSAATFIAAVVFSHLGIPVGLSAWLVLHRPKTGRVSGLLDAVVCSVAVVFLSTVAGNWAMLPPWTRPMLLGLVLVAAGVAVARARRLETAWPDGIWQWVNVAASVAALLFMLGGLISAGLARRVDREPLALAFPLSEVEAYVVHGGNSPIVNAHQDVPAQRHALDMVVLNRTGMRANGLLPRALGRYAAFGRPVRAPCHGEVLAVRDGLQDQVPPTRDTKHILGNYVIVFCDGASVLLAHLQQGSITTSEGDRVRPGQPLAKVGNTGNTSEPHLHMHAVRGRVTEPSMIGATGEAVPMAFDQPPRVLVRGDIVRHRANP